MEPTSEQELKQLLEEGRITEEEYADLKQAMAEKNRAKTDQQQGDSRPKSVDKLGKIALILTLGGIIIPPIIHLVVDISRPMYFSEASNNVVSSASMCVLLFLSMELAGFIMGIISWKSGFGKAATIIVGVLLLIAILNGFIWYSLSSNPEEPIIENESFEQQFERLLGGEQNYINTESE